MIYNVHRINPYNCGDLNCSPIKYFNFGLNFEEICIEKICLNSLGFDFNQYAILGGGGLFYRPWLETISKFNKAVLWGVGLNLHNDFSNSRYPKFIDKFLLVGVRDYNHGRWVPCVSCMSNFFDNPKNPLRDVVVYEHAEQPLETNFPKLSNNSNMRDAIDFISSGEYVITNTYHGAYWGTILKRKVIVVPLENSSRFFFFKHKPVLVDKIPKKMPKAKIYSESLDECRDANKKFYQDFLNLIYGKMM